MPRKANGKMKVASINMSITASNSIKHLVRDGFYNSRSEAVRIYINEGLKRDALLFELVKLPEIKENFKEIMQTKREAEKLRLYQKKYRTQIIEDIEGKEWKLNSQKKSCYNCIHYILDLPTCNECTQLSLHEFPAKNIEEGII